MRMPKQTVKSELEQVTHISKRTKEGAEKYRARLIRGANALDDDTFEAMSSPAQKWVNAGIKAIKEGNAIAVFPGDKPEKGDGVAGTAKSAASKVGGGIRIKQLMLKNGMDMKSEDMLAILEEEGITYKKSTTDLVRADFRQTIKFLEDEGHLKTKVLWKG